MRTTTEYLALQLAYDPARAAALVTAPALSTARFESAYREMNGFGLLDLVFEDADEIFVVHCVGIDVVALAAREGPALLWPATLALSPAAADAIENLVTPWLTALTRGRGLAGEYVREYRPSAAFAQARVRGLYGAATCADTLPVMAPFVYARRFAVGRAVRVACRHGALAAAVVGTVARSVTIGGVRDAFEQRWYGDPRDWSAPGAIDVAIVDGLGQAEAAGVGHAIALRPGAGDGTPTVAVPIPVPVDHLFTYDPADAPDAGRFAVRVHEIAAPRPRRPSAVLEPHGGSSGTIALVVRDDASFAPDADTDTCGELCARLRAEGFDAFVTAAADARVGQADLVHIFGGVGDPHIGAAAGVARAAGLPYFLSVEPLAPYAAYREVGALGALRLGADRYEQQQYLKLFAAGRLRFDDLAYELTPEAAAVRDRAFGEIAANAAGVFLAPCDTPAAFRARFPSVSTHRIFAGAELLAPEVEEEPVGHIVPARRFLLVHAPLTRRCAPLLLLSVLGEAPFGVVVAGPMSEVDIGFTLRRVGGSGVVVLPDPTPGQIASLYRRAHAVAFPAWRPTGAGRLLRAALCGAMPVVGARSPLAALVPPQYHVDEHAPEATRTTLAAVMAAEEHPNLERLAATLAPLADRRAAFALVTRAYAAAPAATSAAVLVP